MRGDPVEGDQQEENVRRVVTEEMQAADGDERLTPFAEQPQGLVEDAEVERQHPIGVVVPDHQGSVNNDKQSGRRPQKERRPPPDRFG